MELYVVPIAVGILGLLGGGLGVAAFNWLTGRRKMQVEITGLQDTQTIAWRDNALKLSEALLLADQKRMDVAVDLHNEKINSDNLLEQLNDCLKAKLDCECSQH